MMRRIIQNQRTIIEQNAKIIKSQERQEAHGKEEGKTTNVQVPNFAKVSTVQFSVLGRKKRSYERIYLQH
jgi:hypothetical protein